MADKQAPPKAAPADQKTQQKAGEKKERTYVPVTGPRPTLTIQRGGRGPTAGGNVTTRVQASYSVPHVPAGVYQQMSNLGVTTVKTTREREKHDLQDLNSRLANYIEKSRFLEAQNRKLSSEVDDLKSKWDKDKGNAREMYEAELDEARKLLTESENAKAELEIRCNSLREDMEDMQKDFDKQKKDSKDKDDALDRLNNQLNDYEAELAQLRRRVGALEKQKLKDQADLKETREALVAAKTDLDTETLNRVIAENEKQSLAEELEFLKRLHEQEIDDLKVLAGKDSTEENREFWKNEMSDCLSDIQREYDDKIDLMKANLEAYYNTKMQEYNTGNNRANTETNHLKDQNKTLNSQLNDLKPKINDLQSKCDQFEKMYKDLRKEYDERQREWEKEKDDLEKDNDELRLELEGVLTELQNIMDAKLSLELEIAAYRKLLESEETRIGLREVVEQMVGDKPAQQQPKKPEPAKPAGQPAGAAQTPPASAQPVKK